MCASDKTDKKWSIPWNIISCKFLKYKRIELTDNTEFEPVTDKSINSLRYWTLVCNLWITVRRYCTLLTFLCRFTLQCHNARTVFLFSWTTILCWKFIHYKIIVIFVYSVTKWTEPNLLLIYGWNASTFWSVSRHFAIRFISLSFRWSKFSS